MQAGFENARFIRAYSREERFIAAQKWLKTPARPLLGQTISLTPNAPYASNGTHLSFWKPSFVLGTPLGGEAGVNFWGIHVQGHVNIGFAHVIARTTLLDCRMLSVGPVTYKIYAGTGSAPASEGKLSSANGHFLLVVPGSASGAASIELWPTSVDAAIGFFGCEISSIKIPRG
jgi:hypothetical protein